MVVRRGVVARVEVKREHDALDPFVADGGELLAALSPEGAPKFMQGDHRPSAGRRRRSGAAAAGR